MSDAVAPGRMYPSLTADERTTLEQFLDYYRATLALKAQGLDDEQARRASVPPSDLSVLGLVRHMAEVERGWFRRVFSDETAPPLFYGASHPAGDIDGDFHPSTGDTLAAGLEAWESEVAHARRVVATASLDDLAARRPDTERTTPTLRWILVHMIEEYARHCGHADLIRQAIDGTTGE